MNKLVALLMVLLAGCAANAQTRPASVNVDALLRVHPLYGTIAQYDRQIAALQGTLHSQFQSSGASFTGAISAMRSQLNGMRTRYASARSNFPQALPITFTADAAPDLVSTYEAQRSGMQDAARRDMATFRTAVFAQEQTAYRTFVRSVNDRSQRAYAARSQELRERESNLLLELARRDAGELLLLQAKLQTLALSAQARAHMRLQIAQIRDRENAVVAVMRREDRATLARYSGALHERATGDVAQMNAQLQARTSATLAARQRVLAAQISGPTMPLPQEAGAGKPSDMRAQYSALVNMPAESTSAFGAASSDLAARFSALRATDAGDTGHTRSQIARLEHDREAVRKRMVAQILYEAGLIAKARGLSQVYPSAQAPPGSADLTSAVASELRGPLSP